MSTFNIFQSPTKCDIKVGYISTDRGYVAGIGLYQANVIAKRNPGLCFDALPGVVRARDGERATDASRETSRCRARRARGGGSVDA